MTCGFMQKREKYSVIIDVWDTELNYIIKFNDHYRTGISSYMEEEVREKFNANEDCYFYVYLYDADGKLLKEQKLKCSSSASGHFVINLTKEYQRELQKIFFFTASQVYLNRKKITDPRYIEKLEIGIEVNEKRNGIYLKPSSLFYRNISSESEIGTLLSDMSKAMVECGVFTVTDTSKKEKVRPNVIQYASEWKNVHEFDKELNMVNCIYYLATDYSAENKEDWIYVGEAVSLKDRVGVITSKKTGKKVLVHHKQKNRDEAWDKDLENFQFTRYRIDRLPSTSTRDILHAAQDSLIGGLDSVGMAFKNGFKMANKAYSAAHNARKK